MAGWQKFQIARNRQWPSPKGFDSDKNFQPKHMLFRHIFKICCDFCAFSGDFGEKSAFWGQKQCFWPEVHYEMVYVAYYTALDLHIFNDAKKTLYFSQKQ